MFTLCIFLAFSPLIDSGLTEICYRLTRVKLEIGSNPHVYFIVWLIHRSEIVTLKMKPNNFLLPM